MQEDLDADHPSLGIEILSINQIGAESGANSLSSDMDLPMVQDTTALSIWNSWGGDWRDVWILDENNSPYAVVNLTTYGLSTAANYDHDSWGTQSDWQGGRPSRLSLDLGNMT